MKIGDIVKLIAKPQVDWMLNYLDKTFQVLDFPTETGVEVMMVGSRPEWVWLIGKDNLEVSDEAGGHCGDSTQS
ncbi:MAG: hypothetical protein QF416_11395 [Candidatus Marinimicrobia bacterium]|nr:hypothetical protein [Candidatus Neomarinimicrobiota bacterium]